MKFFVVLTIFGVALVTHAAPQGFNFNFPAQTYKPNPGLPYGIPATVGQAIDGFGTKNPQAPAHLVGNILSMIFKTPNPPYQSWNPTSASGFLTNNIGKTIDQGIHQIGSNDPNGGSNLAHNIYGTTFTGINDFEKKKRQRDMEQFHRDMQPLRDYDQQMRNREK